MKQLHRLGTRRDIPASIFIARMILFISAVYALWNCFKRRKHKPARLWATVSYTRAVYFVLGMSLAPHAALLRSSNNTTFPVFWIVHSEIQQFHNTDGYGIFGKTLHVDGRLDIVIEGSNDVDGPWVPYNFKFKPTKVNGSSSFVAPHQPGLDWQRWYAALDTYNQNPGLMPLVYRLLFGEKEVLRLMDTSELLPHEPEKYMKSGLYADHFSPWNGRFSSGWWYREKLGEYVPVFAMDHSPLKSNLEQLKILEAMEPGMPLQSATPRASEPPLNASHLGILPSATITPQSGA